MQLEVSPQQVEDMLSSGSSDLILVDVREHWELTRGVLPGAVSIPLSVFDRVFDLLPPNKQVVFYCEHGIRSLDVAMWIKNKEGYSNVSSMKGGFVCWSGDVSAYTGEGGTEK